MFYKYFVLTHFEIRNSAPVFVSRKCSGRVLLRSAFIMSNTQLVFADGTVFYASKVRKDALFMEYKYAWDDVKLVCLQNEI